MHASKNKSYETAGIRIFKSAEEVWDHYKDKGTPEELEGLRRLFRLEQQAKEEPERPPLRRRA